MNASKENSAVALSHLARIYSSIGTKLRLDLKTEIYFLNQFLESAQRKLPTDAAFAADKKRRSKKVSS